MNLIKFTHHLSYKLYRRQTDRQSETDNSVLDSEDLKMDTPAENST